MRLRKTLVVALLAVGCGFAIPAAATVISQSDFSSLPAGAVLANVEVSDNAIVLSQDGSGNYVSEGYIDIPFSPDATGYLVQIDAERVNLFENGDFESDQTVFTYYPSGAAHCNYVAKGTGLWFSTFSDYSSSTAIWPSNLASITADPDNAANYVGKLKRSKNLLQIVPVTPGATYTLAFDADLTRAAADYALASTGAESDQGLVVKVDFQDSSYNNITFLTPNNDETATTQYLNVYYADDGEDNFRAKLLAMDCQSHEKYAAGTGTYASDVDFNLCQDASGTPLTASSDDGTVTTAYSESDIAYAAITFASSWFGASGDPADDSAYYALIDNATLHRDDEIEVELLDASGTVLQSSTVEEGFYLESDADAATLRIYLRTDKSDETPVIRSVAVKDGWDVSVAAGAKTADFTEERLGTMYIAGPKTDVWNPDLTVRSLCTDPIEGDEIPCFDLNSRYDMNSYRMGLTPSNMELTLNADGTDYDFTLTEDGEIQLSHIVEYAGYGMDMLAILQKDGAYKYNDPDDGRSWAVSTYADEIPDPTGARDATAQAYYLMEKYARFWAEMLNGSTTYTYTHIKSGASEALPKVTDWEIFNEDNINDTEWLDLEPWPDYTDATERASTAETMADLAEDFAGIVKTAIPDARISFTGMAAHYGPVFNTDDTADYLATLDPALFDMTNFHPYSNDLVRDEDREDVTVARWEAMESTLASYGFSGKDNLFTEYGDTHEIYDPGCAYDATAGRWETTSTPNVEWERGYGENAHAKLTARQTLALLGLPAATVKPYGMHTYENESHGFDAEADGSGGYECWRSHSIYNFHVFDRVEGYGVLDGVDEPSRYVANAAGKAYVTLAKHLSISSPMASAITSTDTLASDRDYFRSRLFETAAGEYVLALWWYQDYSYGAYADWMSYMSGTHDESFTEKRLLNVTITGVSGLNSAELVLLDDNATSTLPITEDASGIVVKNVPVGEMPVLVKLEYDPALADSDGDGVTDGDDNCDSAANADQGDSDADGAGDACDDSDGDGSMDDADCDDARAQIYPGATEICNRVDDDCDGTADDGLPTYTHYRDADADTYGHPRVSLSACRPVPPPGYVRNRLDCDDTNAAVTLAVPFYLDSDGDRFGNPASSRRACRLPAGYVRDNTDCNDAAYDINPIVREVPDGIDNNCDSSDDR